MSLRARLLTGLVAVIAVFLIVMGTVSIIVLGTLERDQFNANLRLAGRQSVSELVKSTDGYSAVYLSLGSGTVGELTADSPATAEMRDLLRGAGQPKRAAGPRAPDQARAARRAVQPAASRPAVDAGHLAAVPRIAARASGVLPSSEAVILVGRPTSAIASQVRGLVLAELITGAALLAILAFCGTGSSPGGWRRWAGWPAPPTSSPGAVTWPSGCPLPATASGTRRAGSPPRSTRCWTGSSCRSPPGSGRRRRSASSPRTPPTRCARR